MSEEKIVVNHQWLTAPPDWTKHIHVDETIIVFIESHLAVRMKLKRIGSAGLLFVTLGSRIRDKQTLAIPYPMVRAISPREDDSGVSVVWLHDAVPVVLADEKKDNVLEFECPFGCLDGNRINSPAAVHHHGFDPTDDRNLPLRVSHCSSLGRLFGAYFLVPK